MEIKCSKCEKIIDPLCADCSKKFNDNKTSWLDYLRQNSTKIIFTAIISSITALVTTYISVNYISPPIQPNIVPSFIYNTGIFPKESGQFQLDYTCDNTPWLLYKIINSGSCQADDLVFSISLPANVEIRGVDSEFDPESLRDRIIKIFNNPNSYYVRFHELPADCAFQYRFSLDCFPNSIEEIKWSVESKSRNWTKTAKITPMAQTSYNLIFNNAYAEESPPSTDPSQLRKNADTPTREYNDTPSRTYQPKNTPTEPSSTPSKGCQSSSPDRSGVSLGGYDPVVMTSGIFRLMQDKGILSSSEAFKIKNEVDTAKGGVSISGVNVLKFCELIIQSLITKNIMTIEQANNIIEKSKKSGGVLLGGYNVIVLEVDILNILLINKIISREEGQKIIDAAKVSS